MKNAIEITHTFVRNGGGHFKLNLSNKYKENSYRENIYLISRYSFL